MTAIDRVMKAYLSTKKLSEKQTEFVRPDLSKFINELWFGKSSPKPQHKTLRSWKLGACAS